MKKVLFNNGGFVYYDDYSLDGHQTGHHWKVKDGIVYYRLNGDCIKHKWIRDNKYIQKEYKDYLTRMITDEETAI